MEQLVFCSGHHSIGSVLLMVFYRFGQVLPHRECGPGTFLDCAINEASPSQRPVRVGKENITLPGSQIFQVFDKKRGRREKPGTFCKLIF